MSYYFQHKYQIIDGWFDFADLYASMVNYFHQGVFVEIGAWLGKSTCCMAELIKYSNKNIKFFTIDTWEGSLTEQPHLDFVNNLGGANQVYIQFLKNMSNTGILEYVTPIKLPSCIASTLFTDNSISFVFIDGGHTYNEVKSDILAWKPKIMKDGYIGGHDYNLGHEPSAGLVRAVQEEFDIKDIQQWGSSWLVKL